MRFTRVALSPDPDLAVAALMIARLEYPKLDARPYIEELDMLGREAATRVSAARPDCETPPGVDPEAYARITALNDYLFKEQRFVGNDDPVRGPAQQLPERSARSAHRHPDHAGARLHGGRAPRRHRGRGRQLAGALPGALPDAAAGSPRYQRDLIIDAFHGGALLSEDGCLQLLRRHAGEDAVWDDAHLLGARDQAADPGADAAQPEAGLRSDVFLPAGPRHHRAAAGGRSVGDARAARSRAARVSAERLLGSAARPAAVPAALGTSPSWTKTSASEQAQIWEHVKTLKRRVASLN